MAGRGWGKTRVAAEDFAAYGMNHPRVRMGIIARTLEDARDVCVEGESGLLSIIPNSQLRGGNPDRAWNRSLGELFLANGTKYELYGSNRPDALHGPQFHRLWGDEFARWIYVNKTLDAALLALRLGTDPRLILTTTPKPLKIIRELVRRPDVVVTGGTTYENRANLAKTFYTNIITKYEGTRLGREQLLGQLLDDVAGALWTHDLIDRDRWVQIPDLHRVVTGVDPAVTGKPTSAETGIVTVGVVRRNCPCGHLPDLPHAFVLADDSLRGGPGDWGKAVVTAFGLHRSDRAVGEVNNGGDLVEANIRSFDKSISYRSVTASRGKKKRAEPVAALYEQHRVHHVKVFEDLEDQMCTWVGDPEDDSEADVTEGDENATSESPDRMDALVWALTDAMIESGNMAPVRTNFARLRGVTIDTGH
jgi:phage terminase large subunit-like protein